MFHKDMLSSSVMAIKSREKTQQVLYSRTGEQIGGLDLEEIGKK